MRGLFTFVCLSIAAACGGPSDTPPGPLVHHYDEMYIAAIPLDQKQGFMEANQKYQIARQENAKAEADFNETTSQLQVARNDQKAAHLQVDSALSQKKSADASNDTNRINNAQRDMHTAEELEKASQARVKYLEAYRVYMQKYSRYTLENQYWQEAQLEQAKAQVGKQNNIAPKGVTYDWYPKQIDERGRRVQKAKDNAESYKQKAAVSRESWIQVQTAADKDAGKPSQAWDPMAPRNAPATAGNNPANPTTPTGTNGAVPNAAGSNAPSPQ